MKHLTITLILMLLLTSCNQQQNKQYQAVASFETSANEFQDGMLLMEQKCYACHSPSASMQSRLAPPMIAVKKHYLNNDTTKEKFVEAIWKWVEKPAIENSRMKGAVRRFGVMPYQSFEKSEIELIANYMFDNEIEQPEWFDEHFKEMKVKKH